MNQAIGGMDQQIQQFLQGLVGPQNQQGNQDLCSDGLTLAMNQTWCISVVKIILYNIVKKMSF